MPDTNKPESGEIKEVGGAADVMEIRALVTDTGDAPFETWFNKLRDKMARARISGRFRRIRKTGNLGDAKAVGEGVSEFRIDYDPVYRVYFGLVGITVVLLLIGGDKKTQTADIAEAKRLWKKWKIGKQQKGDDQEFGRDSTE